VHRSLVDEGLDQLGREALEQLGLGGRLGDDLVVAVDAAHLVGGDAVDHQLELVLEVVVEHPVAERRVGRDVSRAGPRVSQLAQGQQRRLRQLVTPLVELSAGERRLRVDGITDSF
jgi:hypothetical protein